MAEWEKDVYSDMAQSIGYNDETQTMFVTYNTGKTYAYSSVPEDVAVECSKAGSVGDYINSNIKGVYAYTRVGG